VLDIIEAFMDRAPISWWKPFPFTLLLAVAFLGGAVADRQGWLSFLPNRSANPELGPEFDSVAEAWHRIQEEYPDTEASRPNKMADAAIKGMLSQLGDTGHTAFLTSKDAEELDRSIEGSMEGIGVQMSMRQQKACVTVVFPDTPAQNAGLKAGDVFVQVNGQDVTGSTTDQIASLVRGPAGSEVTLRMARPGQEEPIDVTITRGKIALPRVRWHMLPGVPAAHVTIEEFGERVHSQLRKAIAEARAQGARGLIVDVRGNPGGLRDQAVAAASEFLRGGNVLLEEDRKGHRTGVRVEPGGTALDIPIVVLVNEDTVSAGEIFAAAMQDHQRGPIVGTKTFGTGTILMTYRLANGSAMNLAVARWLTPNGRSLWREGLQPDVEVKMPQGSVQMRPDDEEGLDVEKLTKIKDPQLLKALELLREKLPSPE